MVLNKFIVALSILVAATALTSCSSTSPVPRPGSASLAQPGGAEDLKAIYDELGRTGGKVFAVDPKTSTVRIHVFRAGRAARMGHNHVLSAPQFTGYYHLPDAGTSSSRFDLDFRLDELAFDNPEQRSALGDAYSSELTPEMRSATRDHMLGEDGLQADRFPFVRIRSLQIAGAAPKFAARIMVEMHGQAREMWIPLGVEGLPDHLSVTGALVLRQSDFGVQPYSVLGGLLAVEDEVVVEFRLRGEAPG